MEKTTIITIIYALIIIIYIINDLRINKEKDILTQEIMDFNTSLLKERENIVKIIINADVTKEVGYLTLDKIKKELFS